MSAAHDALLEELLVGHQGLLELGADPQQKQTFLLPQNTVKVSKHDVGGEDAGHLAGDHLLPDELLEQLPEQLPPRVADPQVRGQQLLHHGVQPGTWHVT